ncbi:hypothetical protein AB0M41_01575 [Streptomyces sp. NPDC051896]|uniref:hypothetical protein n=1 Tax=Streptomyces sp. NPDC051896 TaxID=3155416 RepID=UPI00342D5D12
MLSNVVLNTVFVCTVSPSELMVTIGWLKTHAAENSWTKIPEEPWETTALDLMPACVPGPKFPVASASATPISSWMAFIRFCWTLRE